MTGRGRFLLKSGSYPDGHSVDWLDDFLGPEDPGPRREGFVFLWSDGSEVGFGRLAVLFSSQPGQLLFGLFQEQEADVEGAEEFILSEVFLSGSE